MGNLKSLVLLWDNLAEGLEIPSKDRAVFKKRVGAEGITFLTVTMAKYGKAVDSALVTGCIDFSDVSFKTDCKGFPLFLGHLTRLLPEAIAFGYHAADIKKLRQLLLMYYKLEVPYEEATINSSIEQFIARDQVLDFDLSQIELENTSRYIKRVLCNANPFDVIPRHGPGAVSNRLKNSQKWHTFRYIPRLDAVFPYDQHFFYNSSHLCDELSNLVDSEEVTDPPSRIVCVPKDSRGPRLICCEPSEFQYIQQGLMKTMYETIESHPLTKGYVNFSSQEINKEIIRTCADYVTLDLSEASDRVSWELVQRVYPSNWVAAFAASRSRYVELPNGTTYGPLRKFAPMGSACCFPVEGLTFWALIRSVSDNDVWVYGDDIVVHVDDVRAAVSVLERAGLAVNTEKSCVNTLTFRESCGGEYLSGLDIGYVKCRQLLRNDNKSRQSWIEMSRQVAEMYSLPLGLKVLGILEDELKIVVPCTTVPPPPGVFSHPEVQCTRNDVFFKRRWSKDLQRFEYKIPVYRARSKSLGSFSHWNEILRKTLTRDSMSEVGVYATKCSSSGWAWTHLVGNN